ncbi:hypothetical protein [Reichenbachiella sp.]|uniref:hypothetical protein n=1 Tax=Reichenbachiella sp. TaxID=2184521 RepID=UPI003299ADB0
MESNIRSSEESTFTNRFSHSSKSKCTGGQGESELHKKAKEILEKQVSISIPKRQDFDSTFTYNCISLEPSIQSSSKKQFRPDIILHSDNKKLAIEVFVTHRVSDEKAKLYKNSELPCIEIDLSDYHHKSIENNLDDIRYTILDQLDSKIWIWPLESQEKDIFAAIEELFLDLKPWQKLIISFMACLGICWLYQKVKSRFK